MLTRIVAIAAIALVAATPLAARADLYMNFHGLWALQTGQGCHIDSRNSVTKISVVRCDAHALASKGEGYNYTDTWGRSTSDPRYGGCAMRVTLRALPPATHVYNVELMPSKTINCSFTWQNNNTLDVRFTDK